MRARLADLRALQTLVAIVEEGSLQAAAQRLHYSQSAISMQLSKLETELGQPLLHRDTRGLRLTAIGERGRPIVAGAEAGDGLDLQVYWRAILHHDEQAPGCTHLETKPAGIELFTFGASAYLPREDRSFSRTIARVDGGLRYGCETPAVESRWRFI